MSETAHPPSAARQQGNIVSHDGVAPSWGGDALDLRYARRTYRQRYFRQGFGEAFDVLVTDAPLARPWDRGFSFVEQDPVAGPRGTRTEVRFVSPDPWLPAPVRKGRGAFFRPHEDMRGVAVLLAATGDETLAHRSKTIAQPLLQQGIGSLVLEAPYYGSRRLSPKGETLLPTVADLGHLFRAQVIEAAAMVFALRNAVACPVVLAGMSRGGQAAVIAACLLREAPPVVAHLAPASAVPVFTDGVLRHEVCFDALRDEAGDDQAARARLASMLKDGDVTRFAAKLDEPCTVFVHAEEDGYVPPQAAATFRGLWGGARFESVPGGHVAAFLRGGPRMVAHVAEVAAAARR